MSNYPDFSLTLCNGEIHICKLFINSESSICLVIKIFPNKAFFKAFSLKKLQSKSQI